MEQNCMVNALALLKRIGNLLNEVQDASQELAGAAERNDQVSVEMLVAMRREPIEKLTEADRALRELVASDPEKGARLAELLNGAPAEEPAEQALAEQAAVNRRRLARVQELDRALNQKLTRGKSVYQ